MAFNGNDTLALRKISTDSFVDVIGQIGFNPGGYWGSGDVTTENHTLVRKAIICAGDTNGGDTFDPATQWDGYPIDTITYLGAHTHRIV
jgi:predicted extracellular nuclease